MDENEDEVPSVEALAARVSDLVGRVNDLDGRVVGLEDYRKELDVITLPSVRAMVIGVVDRVQVNVHRDLKPLKDDVRKVVNDATVIKALLDKLIEAGR